MSAKPKVFVTRRLPDNVEARLKRDYDPRLNADDHLPDADEVVAGCKGADALLPCPTDKITAEVIERLSLAAVCHVELYDTGVARGLLPQTPRGGGGSSLACARTAFSSFFFFSCDDIVSAVALACCRARAAAGPVLD